jgi:hypothetical protein
MLEWTPVTPGKEANKTSPGEFRTDHGRVLYCRDCRRIAVDFAQYYLLFHRSGFDGFLACLAQVLGNPAGVQEEEDVHVGPSDSDESIRLKLSQVGQLASLMEMAALVMDAEHFGIGPES